MSFLSWTSQEFYTEPEVIRPPNTVCMLVPVPRNMSTAKLEFTSPVLKAQLERRLHRVMGHGHGSLNVDFWKGALMGPL